jgi:UDP-N-acetylmuramoyl-tripeptide--D-alanyl-D-alanine ligase
MAFFQLEEYDNIRFSKWSIRKFGKVNRIVELIGVPFFVFAGFAGIMPLFVAGAIVSIISFSISLKKIHKGKAQLVKPLIYTSRAKRILLMSILLMLGLLATTIFWLWNSQISVEPFVTGAYLLLLFGQLTAFYIIIANVVLIPLEWSIQTYYLYSAQKTIRLINPIVIGVTGSFGKTTTKELLFHILSKRYRVLKTPKSYNTLMGICKVIREELKPSHQYFIVEMGAYRPGEIEKICALVQPKYGILTAIGPQHLERFKTIENVAKAKNELMQSISNGGFAVYNGDDPICDELSRNITDKYVFRYGIIHSPSLDIFAENIVVDEDGTRFDVCLKDGTKLDARMTLLGHHNVSNALAAILLASQCGFSFSEAVNRLQTAEPFEHRLKLSKSQNNIIYIDDSYNSNPLGAKIALEVLSVFKSGRKILVTPGFVELGAIEEVEHEKLGFQAGEICDYVFLIGNPSRTTQIDIGIKKGKMTSENVFFCRSLSEAVIKLRTILKSGDVVLLENDLPDLYLQ